VRVLAVIGLWVFIAFAGAFGIFALREWALVAGWLPVALVLCAGILLSIVVHELGHLLAGMAAGMSPVLMIIGPLSLSWRKGRHLPRLFSNDPILGGFVYCVPRTDRPVRPQMIKMLAGGPAASLLLTAVTAAVGLLANSEIANTAGAIGMVSAVLFLTTAIPFKLRGMPNDGDRIRNWLEDGPTVRSMTASQCLFSIAHEGLSPAEWPRDWIDATLDEDALPSERSSGLHLAVWAALDAEDMDVAESLISELETEIAETPEIVAASIAYEVAAFRLFVQRDPAAARAQVSGRRLAFYLDRYIDTLI